MKFLKEISQAFQDNKKYLVDGIPIHIHLSEEGGYDKIVNIRIDKGNKKQFWTDKNYNPETRFPARIRTAAYVLFVEKYFGDFKISHLEGELSIEQIY